MTYAYDRRNRVSTITDANNKVISCKEYDANGNVIKDIDAEGYKSGSSNQIRYGTQYTYNLANLLIAKTTPEAAAKGGITAKYTYNLFGEVLSQTDGTGNTTTYEYDNAGRLTKVTDPAKLSVKYTYYELGSKENMT